MKSYVSHRTVGYLGELKTEQELSKQGFYVFRCNQEGVPFDLVAYRPDTGFLRVEVKTTTQLEDKGNNKYWKFPFCPKAGKHFKNTNSDFVAAVVLPEDSLVWLKSSEITTKTTHRINNLKLKELTSKTILEWFKGTS